jgi:hypothetical protein
MVMDGSHFKAGIKEAESAAKHFGKDVLGELKGQLAAAFGAAAVIEFGKSVIERIKNIKEMSEQFQLTTDQVQEFGAAAIKSGQNVEFIAKKLEHLNEIRRKAGEHPGGEEAKALTKIGIGPEAVQGSKETSELLGDISEEAMHSATAANDFFEVFGKGGQKMIAIIEEIKKAKGKDNSWMMSPKELEETYHGIQKFEELKMKSEAFGGRLLGQIAESPWKGIGPMGVYTFWKTLLGKRKEGSTTEEAMTGGEDSKKGEGGNRYENFDLIKQRAETLKAEFALQDKTYDIEFKRADKQKQIQMMEKAKLEILAEEMAQRKNLEQATGEEEKSRIQESIAKLQTMRKTKEQEIYEANQIGLKYQQPDDLARRGQLTGGSLARASFYDSIGMAAAVQSNDIPKKQLSEAEKQTRHLEKIAENKGKIAIFGN